MVSTSTRMPGPERQARTCPMCNARVGPDALVCSSCSEDLTRSGVMLSAGARPVRRLGRRRSSRRALAMVLIFRVLGVAVVGAAMVSSEPLSWWPLVQPVVRAIPPAAMQRLNQAIPSTLAQRALQWFELMRTNLTSR